MMSAPRQPTRLLLERLSGSIGGPRSVPEEDTNELVLARALDRLRQHSADAALGVLPRRHLRPTGPVGLGPTRLALRDPRRPAVRSVDVPGGSAGAGRHALGIRPGGQLGGLGRR